jgi:hypothetical protein
MVKTPYKEVFIDKKECSWSIIFLQENLIKKTNKASKLP